MKSGNQTAERGFTGLIPPKDNSDGSRCAPNVCKLIAVGVQSAVFDGEQLGAFSQQCDVLREQSSGAIVSESVFVASNKTPFTQAGDTIGHPVFWSSIL
ncbi:MAG: hypothetical protein Cons2KO_33840 [Congregibacter sp.]